VRLLQEAGIQPFALCGLFTASPLLIEEVRVHEENKIPIVTLQNLIHNITELLSKI
jgi:hypothetical protein